MKKTILYISLLFNVFSVNARQSVKIQYDTTRPSEMHAGNKNCKMMLISSPESSLYFNEISMYVDSLSSTPEGRAELKRQLSMESVSVDENGQIKININENLHKPQNLYVTKNAGESKITVYDEWAEEYGFYNEPMGEMKWNIVEDSTRTIVGYECVLAETDYHGRHWKAWFTPEIPIKDGPWKFHGLPGLILLAETPDGNFSFKATGLQNYTQTIPVIYGQKEYAPVERKKALAEHEKYLINYETNLNTQHGGAVPMIVVNKDGKKVEKTKYSREKQAIECDY